jgi:hypothetical protein
MKQRFIQGLASRPIIHPSQQDLSMKLSSQSYGKPKENRKENGKTNELRFQELAAIISPLGLYGGNRKSKMPFPNN